MIKIYKENISFIKNQKHFDEIYSSLPKGRQEKVFNYLNENDRKLSLLGNFLLKKAFVDIVKPELINEIQISENGKPFVDSKYSIYFSISHSKEVVLVVISDKPVGCDVQHIEDIDFKSIMNRYFAKSDIEQINNFYSQKEAFYKTWCIKESLAKIHDSNIYQELKSNDTKYNIDYLKIENNYVYCVISKN